MFELGSFSLISLKYLEILFQDLMFFSILLIFDYFEDRWSFNVKITEFWLRASRYKTMYMRDVLQNT